MRRKVSRMGNVDLLQTLKPGAFLATVVAISGSGYRRPGARMVFQSDGTRHGSVSGGCLERDLIRHGPGLVAEGPTCVLYDTRSEEFLSGGRFGTGCEGVVAILLQRFEDLGLLQYLEGDFDEAVLAQVWEGPKAMLGAAILWRDGEVREQGLRTFQGLQECAEAALQCRESVNLSVEDRGWKILVEYLEPRPELLIVGIGPDARILASLATTMGFRARIAWHDPIRLAEIPDVLCEALSGSSLKEVRITKKTAIVLMTHDLKLDAQLTQEALQSPAWYVGLMGPKMRTAKVVGTWQRDGWLPGDEITKLHTPVGLDLGGDSPDEVALSILAEIVAIKNQRTGGHLKDRKTGIHSPIPQRSVRST